MPIIISHEEVVGNRKVRIESDGCAVALTHFIEGSPGAQSPQAMLVEEAPFRHLKTHYHTEDEFQIFIQGSGSNGRHKIQSNRVHFARKYTPYGPIIASDEGCSFLTLRSRTDSGAKFLPNSRSHLESIKNRRPWQISADLHFPETKSGTTSLSAPVMQDEFGMAVTTTRMLPFSKTMGLDPFDGDGQFMVLVRGSLLYEGNEYSPISIIFIRPDEEPFFLEAGAFGLDLITLTLPRQTHLAVIEPGVAINDLKTWRCVLCGFIYDESIGIPDEDIPPGTRWEDVPESFGCPDCLANKADFEMIAI